MRFSAITALMSCVVCLPPILFCYAIFVLLGVVFPLLTAMQTWLSLGVESIPQGLALAYSVMLILVLLLSPVVAQRQLLWIDLVDLRGFPEAFYSSAVLQEIRKRHMRDSMLRQRLGLC